ncbi:MAG TPA: alpha/beta hydrolase [Gemmatimonadaceae bacterium]|nr:alpha/beta hydrolase [Gemmatimonadaceae bacterium]
MLSKAWLNRARGARPLKLRVPSRRGARALLVAALLLFAAPAARAQLALHDCGLSGVRARCGTLQIPENPQAPNGRRLSLNVIVIPRAGAAPAREPLFILKGGPGQAATADTEDIIEMFGAVRGEHDLVLLDQRGTGGSNRLDCEVADRSFLIPKDPKACLTRLSARADLRMYSTARFVEDLETARSAMGYEQISLYGGSYGTRAADYYARRHPERVRTLVLVAPAPRSMPLLESFEEDGERALNALVKDCALDSACSKAFSHLDRDVQEVRKQLTDSFHVIGIQLLQYSSSTARYLPLFVSEAARGRREPLDQAIAAARERYVSQLSIGLHLAVSCSEELTHSAAPAGRRSALRAEYEIACRDWPRAELPPETGSPAPLPMPALIVVGERDPATSPRWARVMADQFREPRVVVVPGEGHVFDGPMLRCIDHLAADFLARRNLADGCVTLHKRPAYPVRTP